MSDIRREGGQIAYKARVLLRLAPEMVTLALLALAVCMRLDNLGVPFDRDSYDEGVYWQTLRAMSAGHQLYSAVFFSQPPAFMYSVFPFYMLFGHTIWAARLAVVVISVIGLVGAYLLGRAFGARIAGLAAVLLLLSDPYYLKLSRTLQAEGVAIPLSLLAVALAYLWWQKPRGRLGYVLAALAGVSLSLSVLSKLLTIATVMPLGVLAAAHVFGPSRRVEVGGVHWRSAVVGLVALAGTSLLLLLPSAGALGGLWQGVVAFHVKAADLYRSSQSENMAEIRDFLIGSPTTYAAFCGILVSLLRRDLRVLPLVVWLVGTLAILWAQVPLFPHHLAVLTPVLVALAVAGIGPMRLTGREDFVRGSAAVVLVVFSVLVASAKNWQACSRYLIAEEQQAKSDGAEWLRVAGDLRAASRPGELVITDSQFIAGLADRSVPTDLVDTSSVRITTRYLSADRLLEELSRPEVGAVLFYTGRLTRGEVSAFVQQVRDEFRLSRRYGDRRELWVKPERAEVFQQHGLGSPR